MNGGLCEGTAENDKASLLARFSTLEQLKSFSKLTTKYRQSVGNFMRQSQQAVVLILGLRAAKNEAQRNICIATAEELGIQQNSIHLSVTNAIDAMKFLELLQFNERQLEGKINQCISTSSYQEKELSSLNETVYHWCKFICPEEFPTERKSSNKKSSTKGPTGDLRECLIPTKNRIRESLKVLKKKEFIQISLVKMFDGSKSAYFGFRLM